MDKGLYDRVFAIAKSVRQWTQESARKARYHPSDLMGWCAISSAKMLRELKAAGIDGKIHVRDYYDCHCFVVVDDHVVDVTATQFDEFKSRTIVIMHIKEAEQFSFYQHEYVFDYPDELRAHQLKTNWPKKQIAFIR